MVCMHSRWGLDTPREMVALDEVGHDCHKMAFEVAVAIVKVPLRVVSWLGWVTSLLWQ